MEFRERGVRLHQENRSNYPSANAAYRATGGKLGCSPDSLSSWCHQAERDAGERVDLTSDEKRKLKESECENCELRTANEILKKASALFRSGGARSSLETMTCFIDEYRGVCGVEAICKVLQMAPFTSYARVAIMRNPDLVEVVLGFGPV